MSVINQMLVDLERRRASGEERNHIPDHVRALPGESQAARLPAYGIAAVMAVVAALAVAGWWWGSRAQIAPGSTQPASAPAEVAVPPATRSTPPPPSSPMEETVAQRLSLELSQVPDSAERVPEPVQREALPVTTASVIAPRPASAAPVPVVAEKPSPAPPPVIKKAAPVVAAPAPSPVEIDKQVRQPTPRQRADAEYARGATALHRGQFAEARVALEAALQMDPSHHGARQALVGVLLDSQQPAEAVRVLQEGLQLAPAQQGFAMTLARLQVENGGLDAAVQTLANSLNYPGVSPDYIAFYAGLLQRQNKHAEAIVQFQSALARRGNVGLWLLGLGVSLEALGHGADAQEAYRRAKASGNLSDELQAFVSQRLR